MSIRFEKSTLMGGRDYQLTQSITLHHPTVSEFLDINDGKLNEQIYWSYVSLILSDPYSNMVMLDDIGKDFMQTSPFEVFMIQWDKMNEEYLEKKHMYDQMGITPFDSFHNALKIFMVEKDYQFIKRQYEDGSFCLADIHNPMCQINEEVYNYIYEWVKSINKIDYSDRIKPADENARRILIEDTRDEIKKQKRKQKKNNSDNEINYIGTLMSAVSFGGNGVITPFNIQDCKLYWLFEAISIDSKKSNASHILDGIYHGTLSSKDINKKELDWTK